MPTVMMRILLLTFFLTPFFSSFAQLTDDFSDGDFSNNPTWMGNTDRFQINANELQLNDADFDASVSGLYVNAPTQGATTWEFLVRMEFNPSSSNYTRVYLSSDATDFATALNGYFVLIGGTDDVVELRRQTGGATTALISSPDDAVDVSVPIVRVRVTRSATNEWELSADLTGGTSFTSYGTAVDASHPLGFYFGVRCNYTETRKDKFFFDDILVDPLYVDTTPPEIIAVNVLSSTSLTVQFDEPLDPASAVLASNYVLDNGAVVASAVVDLIDPTIVIITLAAPLMNFTDYTLSTTVEDIVGNASSDSEMFTFAQGEPASPYDMMINEFMADPSPTVGLPDAEFVEIYNNSNKVFDLAQYELSSGSTPQQMPPYFLLPNEYVVVCDDSNESAFQALGLTNVVAVSSFNALTNGGDNISLTDLNGILIHSVDYDSDWYQDADKDDGGWTLELINPDNPCDVSGSNWIASESPLGGTPGSENSVFDNMTNSGILQLLTAEVLDPNQIQLTFSTAMDNSALATSNYNVDNTVGNPDNITIVNPSTVIMEFNTALSGNIVYTVTVSNLADCAGNNTIDVNANTATFQLPEPKVLTATIEFPNQVVVLTFDTAMDPVSVEDESNYTVQGVGMPSSAIATGPLTAELTFPASSFINGTEYNIEVSDVSNTDGTIIAPNPSVLSFFYYEPVAIERYDILINEIMPDPTPTVGGLPEVEFIELYNNSDKVISLEGFSFVSGSSSSSDLPLVILEPGAYIIISDADNSPDESYADSIYNVSIGTTISMTNSGDDIALYDADGNVVDAIVYNSSWYNDASRDDGGYSIERINPNAPCSGGENWMASQASAGATPGKENSVFEVSEDTSVPTVDYAFPESGANLDIYFSKSLDAMLASDETIFSIDQGIVITQAVPKEPIIDQVRLIFDPSTPLQPNIVYTLTISSALTDCIGNPISEGTTIQFALPDEIEAGDILINEVLFDPYTGGSDFVELYNHSEKILNIGDLIIVNDVAGSAPNHPIQRDFLLFPMSYVVITSNPSGVTAFYDVPQENLLIDNSLPTLSPDLGNVTLLSGGNVVDFFDFDESYHTELIDDGKGVSLERIDFDVFTNDRNHWHSAASNVGYATPGYKNSQTSESVENIDNEVFTVNDDTFSPDNDGYKDFLRIDYATTSNGNIVNMKVFDAKGRIVKDLVENELLSTRGFYQWDGTNNEGGKARIGIYVIWIEMFDDSGAVSVEKKTCVLAGQF